MLVTGQQHWLTSDIHVSLQIRMRNDVQPSQSTMVSQMTFGHQTGPSADAQREIQLLRQEIIRLKTNLGSQVTYLIHQLPSKPLDFT